MKKLEVDVAVIGAGSAGMAAYREARKHGVRAVLIESGAYGTTCARVACMPSKLLIAAANAMADTRLLSGFGIELSSPAQVNGAGVLQRVRSERDRYVASVLETVDTFPAADKLRGSARFLSDTILAVDDAYEVHTRASVIATGARPSVPESFKVFGPRAIVSDDVFDWPELPRSLAIFGTGVVAIELGQALARLGVRVVMFGHGGAAAGTVAGLSDPEVSRAALELFEAEPGLTLDTDPEILEMSLLDGLPQIRRRSAGGGELTERYDYVLVASGRPPALAALGLEHTSAELDRHGVPTFDAGTLQCSAAPIFIAGDANGVRPWLNDAANEGRIAALNAVGFPQVRDYARPAVMSVVFCEPQILMVGQRHKDLPAGTFVTGSFSFADQGRSKIIQRNQGRLNVYAHARDQRFLGAEGIAPSAEHLAHLLAWALQQGLTIQQMLAMPYYHPVIEEGLRAALLAATRALVELRACDEPSLAESVGG